MQIFKWQTFRSMEKKSYRKVIIPPFIKPLPCTVNNEHGSLLKGTVIPKTTIAVPL